MGKSLPLFVLMFLLLTSLFLTIKHTDAQSAADSPNADARKSVDEFNRRFVENCRNMNNKAAAEMWAEDGVDLLPGMDPMVGKTAISKWLAGLEDQSKGAKVTQCDVDWQKIQVSGDTAYEWGINTQTVSVPGKSEPFKNRGKITLIVHRQRQGDLKLALESWNSSPQK
jgi:ketosteroid isomerase-like protein